MIMVIGDNRKHDWKITSESGKPIELQVTSNYDYLGINFKAKGATLQDHQKGMRDRINSKIGRIKALSLETINRRKTAEQVWQASTKKGLLYASEVLTFTKETIMTIERAQNEIARWALGTNRGTAITGLRGELGWKSVQGEIRQRKLLYWAKLMRMDNDRWPRKVLNEMMEDDHEYKWEKEIHEARQWLDIQTIPTSLAANHNKWKSFIKHRWNKKENEEWEADKNVKSSLKWYPKTSLHKGNNFADGRKDTATLIQVRLGSLYTDKKIPCCGVEADIIHVILNCDKNEHKRNDKLREIIRSDKNDTEKMRTISNDTSRENINTIHNIVSSWRKGRSPIGDRQDVPALAQAGQNRAENE